MINNRQSGTETEAVQDSFKWICVSVFLVCFLCFLILKINGIFDFTGKFGIESIQCTELHNNNRVMMLDGDQQTTWGLTESHPPGEQIIFQFRNSREITAFSMINTSEAETVPVTVFFSDDSSEWNMCEGQWLVEARRDRFIMDKTVSCKYLMIENNGKEEGLWPITEVKFES